MSYFNEIVIPKTSEISKAYLKTFNDELKAAFDSIEKFEENHKAREKAQKNKNHMTVLQSINEDEDERTKTLNTEPVNKNTNNETSRDITSISSNDSSNDKSQGLSKKRTKNEVDGIFSPEQDKRQKRNASVKAQDIIKKQVNVNLSQKLRREDSDKVVTPLSHDKDDNKENDPLINIKIKQEKVSMPPETDLMEMESLPVNIKQEVNNDDIAMPPPIAPVPKPRTKLAVEKSADVTNNEETSSKRRTTRTRKQTETAPAPVSARSTRASARTTKQSDSEEPTLPPPETRPKRTRAKKKISEGTNPEAHKENTSTPMENGFASPSEKPRPKRTRRGQKAADKIEPKLNELGSSQTDNISSPILQSTKETKSTNKSKLDIVSKTLESSVDIASAMDKTRVIEMDKTVTVETDNTKLNEMDKTKIIEVNKTKVIDTNNSMDKTVVVPNSVYNHKPETPKAVNQVNETIVIDTNARGTFVLDKPNKLMDATVVLDREPQQEDNLIVDSSLLTDDNDSAEFFTPPKEIPPKPQPTSAVKEKVQQFEEMATRTTRTKTRAMAKKNDEDPTDKQTPPDKIVKNVLSVDTLNKMNNMIFNGKQISSSATKPYTNIPTAKQTASASKLSVINRLREEAEAKKQKEDARKKKEAMLEAKRELHKRKREEKMAAAAAARETADRERRAALQAAVRERQEKQAHADLGKMERQREAERKKQELARKVAETEERRRAEEQARQKRLAEEQKKADEARKKQQEEAAAIKKEAALMEKEIEKRQKEYIEKQKKQRMEDKSYTPLKTPGKAGWQGTVIEPTYMADGFQYLNSDEDEEPVERPIPEWSTSKVRKQQLVVQSQVGALHVDKLFRVRSMTPDLRDIFPNIERARLKRTSSAVWRTPPHARLPALPE